MGDNFLQICCSLREVCSCKLSALEHFVSRFCWTMKFDLSCCFYPAHRDLDFLRHINTLTYLLTYYFAKTGRHQCVNADFGTKYCKFYLISRENEWHPAFLLSITATWNEFRSALMKVTCALTCAFHWRLLTRCQKLHCVPKKHVTMSSTISVELHCVQKKIYIHFCVLA